MWTCRAGTHGLVAYRVAEGADVCGVRPPSECGQRAGLVLTPIAAAQVQFAHVAPTKLPWRPSK
jgi:hypothetical protein